MERRFVCGAPLTIQYAFADLVLRIPGELPEGRPADVQTALRCHLEAAHPGPHHDLVRELPSPCRSAVWVCWHGGHQPCGVLALSDCGGLSAPGVQGAGCTLFDGHPGGHDWEFTDPQEAALQAEAELLVVDLVDLADPGAPSGHAGGG